MYKDFIGRIWLLFEVIIGFCFWFCSIFDFWYIYFSIIYNNAVFLFSVDISIMFLWFCKKVVTYLIYFES